MKCGYGEGSNYANNFAPENSGTNVVAVGGTGGNNIPEMDIYNAYECISCNMGNNRDNGNDLIFDY